MLQPNQAEQGDHADQVEQAAHADQVEQVDAVANTQAESPFIPPPFVPIANSTDDLITIFGPFAVTNPAAEQVLNDAAEEGSPDFPTDFEGQSALVRKMYDQIFEIEDIVDNKEIQEGLRGGRIGGARNRVKAMSSRNVQLICWELLFEARNAQANLLFPAHGYQDSVNVVQYPSFQSRWADVGQLLRKSKAMVVQLMTPSPIQRAVAGPEAELKQKKANNKGNKGKGKERSEAKRARRARSAPVRPGNNLAATQIPIAVPQNPMAAAQNPMVVAQNPMAVPAQVPGDEANDIGSPNLQAALAQAPQVNNLQPPIHPQAACAQAQHLNDVQPNAIAKLVQGQQHNDVQPAIPHAMAGVVQIEQFNHVPLQNQMVAPADHFVPFYFDVLSPIQPAMPAQFNHLNRVAPPNPVAALDQGNQAPGVGPGFLNAPPFIWLGQ